MSYQLDKEVFATKEAVKARCRDIITMTVDGESIPFDAYPFLFSLFRYHDEWQQKIGVGIRLTLQHRLYPIFWGKTGGKTLEMLLKFNVLAIYLVFTNT